MEHVDFHQFNILTEELDPYKLSQFLFKMCGHPLESFTKVLRGSRFYRYHYTLDNMINVYQEPVGDNRGTNLIEIKGMGCDTLRIDFKRLIADCYESQYKIVNIHLYMDDTNNLLPMQRICTEFKPNHKDRIISRFKKCPMLIDSDSKSLYFGSLTSDYHIIFYEKGLYEKCDFGWNRVELRLSDWRMIHTQLTDYINGVELGSIAAGLLASSIDFKVEGAQIKAKRQTEKFWTDFIGDVEKRSLGRVTKPLPDIQKQISNLEHHVGKKIDEIGSGSIDALISIINHKLEGLDESYKYQLLKVAVL